jgi:hypothetical protein
MSQSALVGDIRAIINSARDAMETLRLLLPAIREGVASDALPVQDPEPATSLYGTLVRELELVERRANELLDRLCVEPSSRVLRGQLLSYEQFHALRCGGVPLPAVQPWVAPPLSEYDTYLLMYYDDGTVEG